MGEVLILQIHNDESRWIKNPDWFLERIVVKSSTQARTFLFPCYRWIESNMVVFQGKGISVVLVVKKNAISELHSRHLLKRFSLEKTKRCCSSDTGLFRILQPVPELLLTC